MQLSSETQKLAPHGRTATRPHQLSTGRQLTQEITRRTQESVKRAYKKPFSRYFLTDMLEACTWGEEYYDSNEEGGTSK